MQKWFAVVFAPLLVGCPTPPPPSQIPNAQAAIDRMRATSSCGNAVSVQAKVDYLASATGRLRLDVVLLAARPAKMRMDALAPLVGSLFTLATDGSKLEVSDKRNHRFIHGSASQANIARITHIPMPIHPFVTVLMGRAPVLKHDEPGLAPPTIAWSNSGYYVVRIPGNHAAVEEIHLAPPKEDWNKPWSEQRLRVLDVQVAQENIPLYHVELDDHAPAPMSPPAVCDAVCKATGETVSPLSGPSCNAEMPRTIHVDVPPADTDVLFRYDKLSWNPPLDAGSFTLQRQADEADVPLD